MSAGDATANATEGRVNYKERLKRFAHSALDPLVGGLARMGLKPDHLTLLGFVLSLGTALCFALGYFRVGALVACASGVCDILDGQLARRTGAVTRFGAFFDSTLDRVAEAAMLFGIAWFFVFNLVDMAVNPSRVLANLQNGLEPHTWGILGLLAMLALVGSFMVSYTRARAEGLGLDCKVGWFERPERMIVLIIAGFAGLGPVLSGALILLTVLSFSTAIQRMLHVWKVTRTAGSNTTEA